MQNTIGHVQSHSGGFVAGGQAAHRQFLGGNGGAIGFRGHEQSHAGLHTGQWQTIPSLPDVLASGVSGQRQSQVDGGAFFAFDVGTMNATQMTAAKIVKIFMIVFLLFLSLNSSIKNLNH